MEVEYLILAKYAEFTPISTLNMIGGSLDRFPAWDFPWRITMITAAVRFNMTYEEATKGHTFKYRITGSDQIVVKELEKQTPGIKIDRKFAKEVIASTDVAVMIDIDIPKAGNYFFQVLVDAKREPLKSTRFRVEHASNFGDVFRA